MASDVGATMMLRSGRFGMPAEWDANRAAEDTVGALVRAESEAAKGEGPSAGLKRCLWAMWEAVPLAESRAGEGGGQSRDLGGLEAAGTFVEVLRVGRRPSRESWQMARRVFSGFITTPAGASWAAQRMTGASQEEGGEEVGPATVAARQVAAQVAGASGIIWAATRDWRLQETKRLAAMEGRSVGDEIRRRLWGDEEGASDEEDDEDDEDGVDAAEPEDAQSDGEEGAELDEEILKLTKS